MTQLIPVVLSGGVGSRLWPLSRQAMPKPFIKLEDGKSFLQHTYERALRCTQAQHLMTVTNDSLGFMSARELKLAKQANTTATFILEPVGRNTAAAIAAAALQAKASFGGDSILLILSADHLIENEAAFTQAITAAKKLAQADKLVTFGIKPTRAETGYGYIEYSGNEVSSFKEKPDAVTAKHYFESANFAWNAGIFCFKVSAILAALAVHSPQVLAQVQTSLSQATTSENATEQSKTVKLDKASFGQVDEISIDYAIFEKAKNLAVVPCNIGWNDIGAWQSLAERTAPDEQGNRFTAKVVAHNTRNTYVAPTKRVVATVGVSNLHIIDTPDALLVADADSSQDVKHIFNQLKNEAHPVHELHNTVYRPWGSYTELDEADGYKVKRIVVDPGQSLSLQYHHHRAEHWVVVFGTGIVHIDGVDHPAQPGSYHFLPLKCIHRAVNTGKVPMMFIEVQMGESTAESDIVRVQDNYGRAS